MKNPYLSPADFWQERDFGKKISAAFDFMGAHFKPLAKCLAYFVLPFTLVMGIGFGMFFSTFLGAFGNLGQGRRGTLGAGAAPFSGFGGQNITGLVLTGLGATLAFLMLSATVYAYVRARLAWPAPEPITPARVWAEMKARLGRLVLAGLLLLGLSLVAVAVFGALFAGSIASQSGGLAVLVGFLVWLAAIYVSIPLSLYLPVLWLEDLGVFASLGRCFQLIKGQWWPTLGLLLVASFLQSVLTYVFAIPQYAILFSKGLQVPGTESGSTILTVMATSFYALGAVFTYTLPLLALVFQYFNLVERREGRGLRLLVDDLGTPAAAQPQAQSDHYRPDDEGEY